jgi:hypothetical protein
MRSLRRLLFVEAAAFLAASLVHSGVLIRGDEHPGAMTAEGIIGAVLLVGGLLATALPGRTRLIAGATQAFALLGSLVGLYLAIRGVGPNTVPDLVFHAGIVITLAVGLIATVRIGDSAGNR